MDHTQTRGIIKMTDIITGIDKDGRTWEVEIERYVVDLGELGLISEYTEIGDRVYDLIPIPDEITYLKNIAEVQGQYIEQLQLQMSVLTTAVADLVQMVADLQGENE